MAPSAKQQAAPPFAKDERVLCFHMEMLYEAKILDVQPADNGEGWQYKIHYKGWKSSWDDWVPQDRVRKFTEENKDLASQLLAQFKMLQSGKAAKQLTKKGGPAGSSSSTTATAAAAGGRATGSDMGSARGSEERGAGVATQSGRGPRRARDFELEHEDSFHNRPSIKLVIPDHLKGILVDDWENVTKNQQLVPLPHPHSVNQVLDDYIEHEHKIRQPDSPDLDIVEEVIAGLREYFDKSLGRILLYRFERAQYHEMYQQWNASETAAHKSPGDTYGAEHLCRLLVTLPELIAQTNMDQQSVNRLREELTKFTTWLGKHATKYFVNEYETPNQEYIDQARNA